MPTAKDAAVTIIVFIALWMAVGVGSNASGVAIYDNFPTGPFYPTGLYTITIKNNSPTINPLIVPLYLVSIQPNNTSCSMFWVPAPSCNQDVWDVGKIDPGGAATLSFTLSPHAQSFTVSVYIYLNLWNVARVPSGSRTIYFELLGNGTYLTQK
jgi:hypothetical protein